MIRSSSDPSNNKNEELKRRNQFLEEDNERLEKKSNIKLFDINKKLIKEVEKNIVKIDQYKKSWGGFLAETLRIFSKKN